MAAVKGLKAAGVSEASRNALVGALEKRGIVTSERDGNLRVSAHAYNTTGNLTVLYTLTDGKSPVSYNVSLNLTPGGPKTLFVTAGPLSGTKITLGDQPSRSRARVMSGRLTLGSPAGRGR